MFNTDGDCVIFNKGKLYNTREPLEFESIAGIYLWISSDVGEMVPVNIKFFKKYFTPIDEIRNNKIDEILTR